MKLMSLKQYMSMSKPALIRKIMKTLRAMPKKKLALACYNISKSKLPRLKFTPIPSSKLRKGTISYKMALRDERKRKALPATPTELQRRQTVQYWQGKTKRKTKRKTKKIVGKIYYTKKGQPYKILASGKARFLKR